MNRLFCILFLGMYWNFSFAENEQQDLCISSIFYTYGTSRGVTMVELSNEVVDTYHMNLYKSLVFKDVSEALPAIQKCLEADKQAANKVKEIVSGGYIQSGYYSLPQVKADINRFILFKMDKKGGATLIYIEGELDSEDLVTLLLMKNSR